MTDQAIAYADLGSKELQWCQKWSPKSEEEQQKIQTQTETQAQTQPKNPEEQTYRSIPKAIGTIQDMYLNADKHSANIHISTARNMQKTLDTFIQWKKEKLPKIMFQYVCARKLCSDFEDAQR